MKLNNKLKQILSWLLVVIWCIIIFLFSAMDSDNSNNKSIKTIEKVVETTVNTTSDLGITEKVSDHKINEISYNLNFPLRKCVHAFVYLILAILVLNALKQSGVKGYKIYFIGLLICFIYSIFDEYHQTFVMGRTGQFMDSLIDTGGSILGTLIYFIFKKLKKVKKIDKI